MLLHSPVKKYEVIARPLSILQNPVIQPGAPVNNFVTVTQCHELQTLIRVHVPPVPGPIQTIGDKKETLWKAFQNTLLYLGKQKRENSFRWLFTSQLHFQTKIHKCARVKTITKNMYPLLRTAWRLVSNLQKCLDGGSLISENPWIIELFMVKCVMIFTVTVIEVL